MILSLKIKPAEVRMLLNGFKVRQRFYQRLTSLHTTLFWETVRTQGYISKAEIDGLGRKQSRKENGGRAAEQQENNVVTYWKSEVIYSVRQ